MKKDIDVHPYVSTLFTFRNLKETGYPFDEESMPLNMWIDLIRLENITADVNRKHQAKRGSK